MGVPWGGHGGSWPPVLPRTLLLLCLPRVEQSLPKPSDPELPETGKNRNSHTSLRGRVQ